MAAKTQMSAIQILEEQLKFNPQSRAFSRLADKYRLKGEIGEAIHLCLEGLAEHPNYITGRLILGRCYAEQKNFQAAIEEFKKVCVADKRNHAALKMLADIFIKLGRAEEAGGLYRILFDMEPDNPAMKQLSAKHPSSIQGNVYDILGITPISFASSAAKLKSFGIDESADIQNMDTIQSETQLPVVNAVHDNTSTILKADLLPAQTDEPTGSDIENQLDSIFGDISTDTIAFSPAPSAPAAAAPQNSGADIFALSTGEPTGSDIENQLDAMFGEITPDPLPSSAAAAPQSSADIFAMETSEPTGNDIANQFDAMFGSSLDSDIEAVPDNNETGLFTMTTGDEPTGEDIENQLNSIFGNTAPVSPSASAQTPIAAPAVSETAGADSLTPPMGEPTGEDVGDRLDFLFAEPDSASSNAAGSGEQDMVFFDSGMDTTSKSSTPLASSIPTVSEEFATGELLPDNGEPTGEDIENQLNSLFGGEPFQTSIDDNDPILSNEQYDISAILAEELNASSGDVSSDTAEEEQDVSGDDISSRIDELFAKHGDGDAVPDFSGFDTSDSDEALAAENSGNLFDFNYTENVDSEINDLIASAQESLQSSPSEAMQDLIEDSSPNFVQDTVQDTVQDSLSDDSAPELTADSITAGSIETSADIFSEPPQTDSSIFDLQESSKPAAAESVIESTSDADTVNGEDIEARLKDLFNEANAASSAAPEEPVNQFEELSSAQSADDNIISSDDNVFDTASDSLFTDESLQNENIFTDELIDVGSAQPDLIETAEQPFAIDGDDVQEKIRQLFRSGVNETETIDAGASFNEDEIDERDAAAALELPDHVLTPTLADIYFQQGQPKLSLQIYERLALRDPKDPRLQSKIQEIQDFLSSEANESGESAKKKTR